MSYQSLIGGAINWAQNQEILFSNLQSYEKQRSLVDQISGLQQKQIHLQADAQKAQLGFQQEGIGIRSGNIDLEQQIADLKFREDYQKAQETFGRDIGALRATAAARGIDLGGSFMDSQNELAARFERGQAVSRANHRLQQNLRENQKLLLSIESQSLSSRADSITKEAGIASTIAMMQGQSRAASLDATIRAIGIQRKYAVITGAEKQVGRILTGTGIQGFNFPF